MPPQHNMMPSISAFAFATPISISISYSLPLSPSLTPTMQDAPPAPGAALLQAALHATRAMLPPFNALVHKGQAGRLCVIGGSAEYVGAPFFAAMAALRMGADLATVVTHPLAAPAIKSMSPDLVVLPSFASILEPMTASPLRAVHAFVVGPGLSRSDEAASVVAAALANVVPNDAPLVLDADALWHLAQSESLREMLARAPRTVPAILTPNVVELQRLLAVADCDSAQQLIDDVFGGNALVVVKGTVDHVVTSSTSSVPAVFCARPGSGKRVGGQGDILAGIIAVCANWAAQHARREGLSSKELLCAVVNATAAACALTREAARRAFVTFGRSLVASDILPVLGKVMRDFEEGHLTLS